MKKRTSSDLRIIPKLHYKEDESIANLVFTRSSMADFSKNQLRSPQHIKSTHISPKSINPDEIKELIKLDKDKNAPKLSFGLPTRDVSHLKDKLKFPPLDMKIIQNVLPVEIEHLEKVIKSSDQYGISNSVSPQGLLSPLQCRREPCVERTLLTHQQGKGGVKSEHDSIEIERYNLGNPTGRQDIENLRKWLQWMKETYVPDFDFELLENSDSKTVKNTKLIYTMCFREIARQVSVQCIERGETLQEIFEIFSKINDRKTKKLKKIINEAQQNFSWKREEMKNNYENIINRDEKKIEELQKLVEKKANSKRMVKEKADFYLKQWELAMEKLKEAEDFRRIYSNYYRTLTPKAMKKSIRRQRLKENIKKKFESSQGESKVPENQGAFSQEVSVLSNIYGSEQLSPQKSLIDLEDVKEEPLLKLQEEDSEHEEIECEKCTQTEEPENNEENKWIEIEIQTEEIKEENKGNIEEKETQTDYIEIENEEENVQEAQISIMEIEEKEEEPNTEKEESESLPSRVDTIDFSLKEDSKIEELEEKQSEEPIMIEDKSVLETKNEKEKPIRLTQPNRREIKIPKNQKPKEKKSLSTQPSEIQSPMLEKIVPDSQLIPEKSRRIIALDKLIAEKKEAVEAINLQIKNKTKLLEKINAEIENKEKNENQAKMTDRPQRQATEKQKYSIEEPSKRALTMRDERKVQDSVKPLKEPDPIPPSLKSASPEDYIIEPELKILVHEGADIPSWKAGYSVGYEKGRHEGFLEGEKLGIEEGMSANYLNTSFAKKIDNKSDTGEEDFWEDSKVESNSGVVSKQESCILDGESDIEGPLSEKRESIDGLLTGKRENYDNLDGPLTDKRGNIDKEPLETNISLEEKIITAQTTRVKTRSGSISENEEEVKYKLPRDFSPKKHVKSKTKFKEFHFSKKLWQQSKKPHPAINLLERFLGKKIDWIKKKATMSKRMVNRLTIAICTTCANKFKVGETVESLICLTYDDFIQRYGLKQVAEKKMLEFIASLFSYYSESKRAMMFLRFINASEKIGAKTYSKLSFEFYVQALDFMLTSNVGVVIGLDDTDDKILLPTVRGIEFINNRTENRLAKDAMARLCIKLEKMSVPDPNKINVSLIDMDKMLDLIIETYEDYLYRIDQGLYILSQAIKYGEDKDHLLKSEFQMLVRNISPNKAILKKDEFLDEGIEDICFDIQFIYNKCLERNLFSIDDIKMFYRFNSNLTHEQVRMKIEETKEKIERSLQNLADDVDRKIVTFDKATWSEKLNACERNYLQRDPNETLLAWSIYEIELKKLEEIYKKV
ncbi:unnamed protein product [Blepharisma stoltei]|uniref:Uncharacterized protein n=1 Tax=Blepharisma stoltei TaxID=1481888 RepID=A0AAU9JL87_9CILI|nr:unnamed protein product [Blepharisma stoltei]